jgi:hypothetical protein
MRLDVGSGCMVDGVRRIAIVLCCVVAASVYQCIVHMYKSKADVRHIWDFLHVHSFH